MTAILEDIVSEGGRLLELAARDGVDVRLLGGVAIRLRAPGEYPQAFDRAYKDLDFAVPPKTSAAADVFGGTAKSRSL